MHTFLVLVFRWHAPAWTSKYVIAAIFMFITLMMGISFAVRNGKNGRGQYYGSTGYCASHSFLILTQAKTKLCNMILGCWIHKEYDTEQIIFEYLWMWIAAFTMLILYGIIALVMRGTLVINGKKWKFNWNQSARESQRDRLGMDMLDLDEQGEEERQSKAIANLMLLYVLQLQHITVPFSTYSLIL